MPILAYFFIFVSTWATKNTLLYYTGRLDNISLFCGFLISFSARQSRRAPGSEGGGGHGKQLPPSFGLAERSNGTEDADTQKKGCRCRARRRYGCQSLPGHCLDPIRDKGNTGNDESHSEKQEYGVFGFYRLRCFFQGLPAMRT